MALPLLRSSLSEALAAAECKNFSGPGSENEPILSPLEAQQTLEIGTSPVETPVLPDLIDDDDDEDDVEGGDEADDGDGDNSYDLDGGEVHNREM